MLTLPWNLPSVALDLTLNLEAQPFRAYLKQFRGIATRFCKLFRRLAAFIFLAGWFLITKG